MTSLGTLTLDLRLNDVNYTKDLLAAQKLARRFGNDITINIKLKDEKFFKVIERAQKAKDQFRGSITTEFKANTKPFLEAQQAAKAARKEFEKPLFQKIRLGTENYKQDLKGARQAATAFKTDFLGRSIRLPRLDTAGFENNLRTTGTRGGDILTGIFQGVGQQITQLLTNSITSGLRAGAGALTSSAREFAGFDQQLNLLAVRTGESREELAEFEKVALRVGLTTSKLPAEAAAAAVELAQLGERLPGITENLDDVVGASEATGISITGLGRALRVGTNIFGDTGETIESLADKFTVLANSTAVTSETDFLQFLSKSGTSAKNLDFEFNELAASFATLRDLGASPEVAATGVRNIFQRFTGTTAEAKAALTELEEVTGRQVKIFDDLGSIRSDQSLLDTLRSLREALSEFSQEDQLDLLGDIFSPASAAQVQTLLAGLETNYVGTLERLTQVSGDEAERASKVLISGFSGALSFIAGSVSTFQVEVGRSFNSLLAPIAEGVGNLLTNFLLDQDPLAPIRESADRLSEVLVDIPGLGESIQLAFNKIVGAGIDSIVTTLDSITAFLQDNPDALPNFVEGFTSGFLEISSIVSDVFGELSDILVPIVGIGANVFEGFANQSELFIGILGDLNTILSPVIGALKALSDNAALVDLAFKSIIAVNIVNTVAGLITPLVSLGSAALATATALSTAAAAGNFAAFSAALAPVTALTGSLTALAASATAVLGPLALLAAAIASVQFLKAAREAKVLNDEIEALGTATDIAGGSGIQSAQRLKNAIEEGNEARKQGLEIDRQALEQRIRLAEEEQKAIAEQRREIERQLAEVPAGQGGFFGIGSGISESQRNALQGQLAQLDAAERALGGQLENAQALLQAAAADAVSAETEAANQIAATGDQAVEEFAQREARKKELVKERLAEIETATQTSNQRIAQQESEAIANVLRQQLSGSFTEDQAAEEISKIQAATLQAQQLAVEERIRLTQSLEAEELLSAEETAKRVAELEAEKSKLIQTQLERQVQAQIDAERERREAAVSEFEKFNDAATRAFEGRSDALQEQLDAEADAQLKAFEESEKLAERELEFRAKQLTKRQDAEKRALAERQQLEQEAQSQRLSALERFVDRELQLEEAATTEERRRLEEQFKEEDERAQRRRELQEEALRNADFIARTDARARGDGLTPFEQEERSLEERQAEAQDELARKQEEQQEKLAALRELQEEEFAIKRETLEKQIAARKELLEDQLANDRRSLEDELAFRRKEAETGLQQDRAAFAEEQRQLDIQAANEVAAILANARPQPLAARRHGGPVGPGGTFLVGEAPQLGPELGILGGKPFLFTQPTILSNPSTGQIYSPEQTRRMTGAGAGASMSQPSDTALLQEVRQLRQQLGRVRDVMPLLDALAQNLAQDTGQLAKDQLLENARWRLRGL